MKSVLVVLVLVSLCSCSSSKPKKTAKKKPVATEKKDQSTNQDDRRDVKGDKNKSSERVNRGLGIEVNGKFMRIEWDAVSDLVEDSSLKVSG